MDGLFGFIAIASLITWIVTRYSFWCLPFVVSIAILAEDNFYPLSYFPMYSDPDESENYLYVAEFEDDPTQATPIPIRDLTGLSAPKVKKMWKSYARDYADELDKKDTELTEAELNEVADILLGEFREIAAGRDKTLPDHLSLVEIWIVGTDEGGWTETPRILGAQPAEMLEPGNTGIGVKPEYVRNLK